MSMQLIGLLGTELSPYLEDIARLRIQIFSEYPYLYQGSMEYEMTYLKRYVDCPKFYVVLAKENNVVVGASTCIGLEYEVEDFRLPLEQAGYESSSTVYFGESVLLKPYRGQG